MQESFQRLSHELAKVEQGQLKASADKGKVIFMIQNAPEELRRLADALEKINISEIHAMVAYEVPEQEATGKAEDSSAGGRAARKKRGT